MPVPQLFRPTQVHRRAPECYGTRRDKRHSRTPLRVSRQCAFSSVEANFDEHAPNAPSMAKQSRGIHNDDLCECSSSRIKFPERIICKLSKKNLERKLFRFNRSRRNRRRWNWIECCFGKNRYKAVWKLFPRSHNGIAVT